MNESTNEPVAYRLHETDIYDFAGWLTTRKGVMKVGASSECGPMADAVGEYIKTFPEHFCTHPQNQKKDEALRLALEALKRTGNIKGPAHDREQIAITLIEQALENK